MCIYIFNGHFIIKIFIHNHFLKNLQGRTASWLQRKEVAEKGQAGQAHKGGCCFFPAQQLTLQGRGASLCSLSPSHSCCQLQAQHLPQKVSPSFTQGVTPKLLLPRSSSFKQPISRHQQDGFGTGFLWCILWVTQKPPFPLVSDVCY